MIFAKFSMSIGILLGSLVLLAAYSDAAKTKKKDHDKRQISPPLLYHPPQRRFQYGQSLSTTYFPSPRYQYNSAFRNVAPIRPNKQLQSTYTGSQYYPKTFNAPAQRRYTSYYFPHRTHYRDWSRKLIEASAYARKLQQSIKQERLQKLKSDPSRAGVKLFVAGVNRNGNALGQWTDHGKFQQPNGQQNQAFIKNKQLHQNVANKIPNAELLGSMRSSKQGAALTSRVSMNNSPPSGASVASKPSSQLQTSRPIVQNSAELAKADAVSSTSNSKGAVVENINMNLYSQTQANSFLDKGSTTKLNANLNEAILSDNLGGATLGPNAHSLLQPTTAQQPAGQNGVLGNVQGSQKESKQSNANPQPQANSIQSFAPLNAGNNLNKGSLNNGAVPSQGKTKNIPPSNDQHPQINFSFLSSSRSVAHKAAQINTQINTRTNNLQANTAQKNTSPPLPNASAGLAAPTKAAENSIDKSTARQLTAGIASTSASRPPSQQPSTPEALPYNSNAGSRNSVPGNINRVKTEIDKEIALKNLLFPPPVSSSNQVHGTGINAFQTLQPQQLSRGQINTMIPSFPAFRYDANLPAIGQTYLRNGIPQSKNKKSMVPQHNPVPFKGSFPLMLHKISPYFKMKRNLKQVASEQAKARRRFLELQRKWYKKTRSFKETYAWKQAISKLSARQL